MKARGTCSVCGRLCAVKRDGTVHGHTGQPGRTLPWRDWCIGSGLVPSKRFEPERKAATP